MARERLFNLLDLEKMDEPAWFSVFDKIEGPLTKCLVLVALIQIKGIVTLKESLQMKSFLLLEGPENETKSLKVLDAFNRSKSLYKLRSEFRGYMGLPRMRSNDSECSESPTNFRRGSIDPSPLQSFRSYQYQRIGMPSQY